MSDSSIPLKCCSCKEQCIHPEGHWLPATTEYFKQRSRNKNGLHEKCRACMNAARRLYRQRPEVKVRERVKKREYDQEYFARPEIKERNRQRVQQPKVRERIREFDKRFSKTPAQRVKRHQYNQQPDVRKRNSRRTAEYSKTDRGKACQKAVTARRRSQKRAAGGSFNTADIAQLYRVQRGCCWYCGVGLHDKYHVDHRIPLSRGGSNDMRNIVLSCADCNLHKYNKLPHEWGDRLL